MTVDSSTMRAEVRSRWSRARVVMVALVVMVVMVAGLRMMVGESFGWPSSGEVVSIRVHRLLIGGTVGAALATAGAVLQALLRNPLASPYVLGVSSGAFLGVMASWMGWLGLAGMGPVDDYVAALLGAGGTLAVVWGLARQRGQIDPLGLLLVGVIVNAINGAAIMFINYLVPHGQRGQMALWLMGYLNENVSQWTLLTAMAATGGGIAAATWLGRSMDAASFSDAEARSLGVDLGRLRMWMFVLAGVLTAGAVMLAGPVGFVGLIAPHAVRMVMGPAHRPLIPASALAGVVLVVGADAAIRLLNIGGGLMPIGIITAIIGGPVFLFMLRGQLRRRIGP